MGRVGDLGCGLKNPVELRTPDEAGLLLAAVETVEPEEVALRKGSMAARERVGSGRVIEGDFGCDDCTFVADAVVLGFEGLSVVGLLDEAAPFIRSDELPVALTLFSTVPAAAACFTRGTGGLRSAFDGVRRLFARFWRTSAGG